MDLMKILDLDLELALEITRDFRLNNFDLSCYRATIVHVDKYGSRFFSIMDKSRSK